MSLLSDRELAAAEEIGTIGLTNPFLPERMALEQRVLGKQFVEHPFVNYWPNASVEDMFPNVPALRVHAERLAGKMRRGLAGGATNGERELAAYENLCLYVLYSRRASNLDTTIMRFGEPHQDVTVSYYDAHLADYRYFFGLPKLRLPLNLGAAFAFSLFFQLQRAFFYIFRYIVGRSLHAARLRAAVWQSIFTHDMRRYVMGMFRFMGNVTTLITGPSGTGKELVARAIALSRFIEFDEKIRRFKADFTACFHGINLAALPSTLIESELFGHVKGSFTGASRDHEGYLDEKVCGPWDTVLLDEIGEIDRHLQVKLLRVLQNREFQRVGDVKIRRFTGKIVAATNCDLASEMETGRIREDFYYRLCADRITTPTLHEQLEETPEDISNFVGFITHRLLPGLGEEAEKLTTEAVSWINRELRHDYPWPGNIRELEQCLHSIMIRGSYRPTRRRDPGLEDQSVFDEFVADVKAGRLSRNELLRRYFSLVYSRCGTYRIACQRLGVDWRTVKQLVDLELVDQFSDLERTTKVTRG